MTPPAPHSRSRGAARRPLALCLRVAGWWWATSLAGIAQADAPAAQTGAAAAPRGVVQVVSGIMGYTRWPGDAPAVRLCTVGVGAGVDELLRSSELSAGQRTVSVRTATGMAQPWLHCDALYLGTLNPEASVGLLQGLVGRPVLVLGEGAAFCSDGGMFCLEPRPATVRFHANLDAIARSGLRVNPLVLRIARANVGGS